MFLQIRRPLSSIRTLTKMLSLHIKRSEVCEFRFFLFPLFWPEIPHLKDIWLQISHDIVEDILVQGDRMRDTLQQLQDAVYFTKVDA